MMGSVNLLEEQRFEERFQILRLLGEGGMGAVYLAEQSDAKRLVALKVMHADFAEQPVFRQRFIKECANLSKLQSKHIVSFYHAAISKDGMPYAVFEQLEGVTLRSELDRAKSLSTARTIEIILQVCSAMHDAHRLGILHRDLKPENIMLLSKPHDDFVKILDFGLSKESLVDERESQRLTLTGDLVGTVSYMSPEQCAGQKAECRSDIYALGCILFECLSGRILFEADSSMSVMHMHANESPLPAIQSLSSKCPDSLLELLLSMLEKSPAKRPASMELVIEELKQVQAELLRGTWSGKKIRAIGRKSHSLYIIVASIVGFLALIFVAGLTFSYLSLQAEQKKRMQAELALKTKRAIERTRFVISRLLEEADVANERQDFHKSMLLGKRCINMEYFSRVPIEMRIRAVRTIAAALTNSREEDPRPYIKQLGVLFSGNEFRELKIPPKEKTLMVLRYLLLASSAHVESNPKEAVAFAKKYQTLSKGYWDEAEPRKLLFCLMSEGHGYRNQGLIQQAAETDRKVFSLASKLGGQQVDILGLVFPSIIADYGALKKSPAEVLKVEHEYLKCFQEEIYRSRYTDTMMKGILSSARFLLSKPEYRANAGDLVKAAWLAAKNRDDIPSELRFQALLQYVEWSEQQSAKASLSRKQITEFARDFLQIERDSESGSPSSTGKGRAELGAKLLSLLREANESSLSSQIQSVLTRSHD